MCGFSGLNYGQVLKNLPMQAPNPNADPESFRVEYKKRVDMAIDFITSNPWRDVTIDDLAGVSHLSRMHFDRIFMDATGETVPGYVERLRAKTPARKRGDAARNRALVLDESSQRDSNVRIVRMGKMHLACIRFIGPYMGIGKAFRTLFCWAVPLGLVKPETLVIGVYHDIPGITPPDQLRSDACISVPEGTKVATPASLRILDCTGDYACGYFEFKDARNFPKVWKYMTAIWLPSSGYQFDDRPTFEIYRGDKMMMDDIFRVDICLPVKPL